MDIREIINVLQALSSIYVRKIVISKAKQEKVFAIKIVLYQSSIIQKDVFVAKLGKNINVMEYAD